MLISHRYKFIFVKTRKTAGTSIEIALSKYLGPGDVITHISPEDEALRTEQGFPGPRNFLVPFSRWRWQDWRRFLRTRQRPFFYNHMPASLIKAWAGAAVWDSYFKFCVERNPWDKVISWYYWEHKESPRPGLDTFIRAGRAQDLAATGGSSLYTIDGKVAVDRIYQYEDLPAAMQDLALRTGLPEVPQLPHAKSRFREDRRPYREVYGEEERELIARIFAGEIAALGYEF
jgi:hypothetical protein